MTKGLMATKKFILNDSGEPKPCESILEWGAWFEVSDRRVALDIDGEYCISTVFLALDYGFGWQDTPIVWETMVFHGREGMWFDRCGGSREQAEAMHATMVGKVKEENRRMINNCARLTHQL